jgi:hypothetical protein
VWLELEKALRNGTGLEQVLPQLQALSAFADELDARIGADGVQGVHGALDLHRRLAQLLDGVSDTDLARIVAAIDDVAAALAVVRRDVERLRRLKAALGV